VPRAANAEQDDLSLLVPKTPCCAKYSTSTRRAQQHVGMSICF